MKTELKLREERVIQSRHVQKQASQHAVAIPAQPAIQQIVENSVQNNLASQFASLPAFLSNLESRVRSCETMVGRLNGGTAVERDRSTSAAGRGKNAQFAGRSGRNNGKGFAKQASRKEGGKPSSGSNPSSNPQQGRPRNQSSNRSGTAEMGGSSANPGRSTNPVDRGGSHS